MDHDNLKNIWKSMFDGIKLTNFENDNEFVPIYMLLKVLQFQIKALEKKRKECKCYQTPEKIETTNAKRELNVSDTTEKSSSNEIEEADVISDTSIVDQSFVTDNVMTSPILKNKNVKYNNRNKIRKKLLLLNTDKTNTAKSQKSKKIKLETIKQKSDVKEFEHTTNKMNIKNTPECRMEENQSDISKKRVQRTLTDMNIFEPKQVRKDLPAQQNNDNKNILQPLTNVVEALTPSKQVVHKQFVASKPFEPPHKPSLDMDESDIDPFAPTFYCPTTPPKTAETIELNEPKICEQRQTTPSKSMDSKEKDLPVTITHKEKGDNIKCNLKENVADVKQPRKIFETSYDRIPEVNNEPEFAYRRNAVRKKADRMKLQGQTCYQCEKFYRLMGGDNEKRYQENLNKCSRHRDNFPPTNTPPGFWKIKF